MYGKMRLKSLMLASLIINTKPLMSMESSEIMTNEEIQKPSIWDFDFNFSTEMLFTTRNTGASMQADGTLPERFDKNRKLLSSVLSIPLNSIYDQMPVPLKEDPEKKQEWRQRQANLTVRKKLQADFREAFLLKTLFVADPTTVEESDQKEDALLEASSDTLPHTPVEKSLDTLSEDAKTKQILTDIVLEGLPTGWSDFDDIFTLVKENKIDQELLFNYLLEQLMTQEYFLPKIFEVLESSGNSEATKKDFYNLALEKYVQKTLSLEKILDLFFSPLFHKAIYDNFSILGPMVEKFQQNLIEKFTQDCFPLKDLQELTFLLTSKLPNLLPYLLPPFYEAVLDKYEQGGVLLEDMSGLIFDDVFKKLIENHRPRGKDIKRKFYQKVTQRFRKGHVPLKKMQGLIFSDFFKQHLENEVIKDLWGDFYRFVFERYKDNSVSSQEIGNMLEWIINNRNASKDQGEFDVFMNVIKDFQEDLPYFLSYLLTHQFSLGLQYHTGQLVSYFLKAFESNEDFLRVFHELVFEKFLQGKIGYGRLTGLNSVVKLYPPADSATTAAPKAAPKEIFVLTPETRRIFLESLEKAKVKTHLTKKQSGELLDIQIKVFSNLNQVTPTTLAEVEKSLLWMR